jgi:hypothetical protein
MTQRERRPTLYYPGRTFRRLLVRATDHGGLGKYKFSDGGFLRLQDDTMYVTCDTFLRQINDLDSVKMKLFEDIG